MTKEMQPETVRPAPTPPRKQGRRWIVFVLVAVVVTVFVGLGQRRVPTDYASGHALYGQTQQLPADKTTIRIATFNIHGAKGEDDVRSIDRIAACLEGFDVIGLNEVHGPLHMLSDRDQAKELGEMLDTAWMFAPTERRWWHDHFGNGLLSSLPVTRWECIPLAGTRHKGHRNVVLAVISMHDRKLHVLVTHLDKHQDREDQLKTVVDMFLDLDPPVVLMGDLNTRQSDPQIGNLLADPGVVEPLSDIRGGEDQSRIDWIFCRGLQVVDAGLIDKGASDHPCVWAELQLTTKSSSP